MSVIWQILDLFNKSSACYFWASLLDAGIWYHEQQWWGLDTWSWGLGCRGGKRTPKSFDLSKISAKSLKIRKKIPQNLDTDVSTPLFSLCDERDWLSKHVWIWLFSSPYNTHEYLFYVTSKKILIIFETHIFRVSLSKFGRKSFAPPKVCLPLHLIA